MSGELYDPPSSKPGIRATSQHQQETDVRDALIEFLTGDIRNPMGLDIVHRGITNRSHPALFLNVEPDEGEEYSGGTFLVTIEKVTNARLGGGDGA